MAEIYRVPRGVRTRGKDRLNYVAAHHVETLAALDAHAEATLKRAQAALDANSDVRTGRAQIVLEKGEVDRYIVLQDEHAVSIEYDHHNKRRKAPSPLRSAIRII